MTRVFNILVVEDDAKLRQLMAAVLKKNGYNAIMAADGEQALDAIDKSYIDLIITDIMMPKTDGFELTVSLREAGYNLPVLMITAREDFDSLRKGFGTGADDYMVKPIDINEMVLRVSALLRRSKIASDHMLTIGGVVINYDNMTVTRGSETVFLPKKEFFLLFKLLSNTGRIFTRQQLMDEIWGMDSEADERTVDVHVKRLRDRFREWIDFEILTVRGLGYKAVKNA